MPSRSVAGLIRFAVVLAAAAVPLTAADELIKLQHGGLVRSYWVHTPSTLSKRPPVLIALHGGGGNARQFKSSSGFDAVSDREGFLAVYPNGSGPRANVLLTWNAGACCGSAARRNVDDVDYLKKVIDDLDRRFAIDRRRVWITGHSNGAMMAYRFAAEAGERIAAVAGVGGAMITTKFRAKEPLPILHVHSKDDPRALYEGGLGPPFPFTNNRVEHRPVEETLQRWIRLNGCPSDPEIGPVLRGEAGTPDQEHTAARLTFTPCRSGFPVVHLKLTGIGHAWPGERLSALRERLLGESTELFKASEVVYRFVSRYRRAQKSR